MRYNDLDEVYKLRLGEALIDEGLLAFYYSAHLLWPEASRAELNLLADEILRKMPVSTRLACGQGGEQRVLPQSKATSYPAQGHVPSPLKLSEGA